MDGQQDTPSLNFALVIAGLVFGDTQADQGADDAPGRRTGDRTGQNRGQRTAHDDWADRWKQTTRYSEAPHGTDAGAGRRPGCRTDGRVVVIAGTDALPNFRVTSNDTELLILEASSLQFKQGLARLVPMRKEAHDCRM
jgi:hypothetical protein